VRQVLIEARIVEASDTFSKSLGVRLGGQPFTLNGGRNLTFGNTYTAAGTSAGDFVNLPSPGVSGFSPGSFAISLFDSGRTRLLNLEITALEADGKGKLVSSPRIVTADQTKAMIEQGTEIPYQQATSSGATAVTFRRATLKLEVTPQITPEGNIILDLDINKDSLGDVVNGVITINTKKVRTQVLVENGGTVVIGGIFELTEAESVAKVPLLGDIPGVGNLFKNRSAPPTSRKCWSSSPRRWWRIAALRADPPLRAGDACAPSCSSACPDRARPQSAATWRAGCPSPSVTPTT